MQTVREHALRIARVPADVLLMEKMALNRVADLNGFRTSVVLGAETGAVLHAIPPAEELRATIWRIWPQGGHKEIQERDLTLPKLAA